MGSLQHQGKVTVMHERLLKPTAQYVEDRRVCEDFARAVLAAYGEECLPLVALPWTSGECPSGVICPAEDGTIDIQQVEQALQAKSIIIVICMFKERIEQDTSFHIMENLHELREELGKCTLIAQIMPPETELNAETYKAIVEVNQAIADLGADDVLVDPDWEAGALKLRIRLAHRNWTVNQRLMFEMIDREPMPPSQQEIDALEAKHRHLLWRDIPNALMPHFHEMTQIKEESATRAGKYEILEPLESRSGFVYAGKDANNRQVVIKMIDKQVVTTPGEIEGINREFRFLTSIVKHPFVIKALEYLHGPQHMYAVIEYAGKNSLSQHLDSLPSKRMETDEAITCFYQVASALEHCHQQDICHRSVSLEHIVIKVRADGSLLPKLIDFHTALICTPGQASQAACGCLPCMAPEMLRGRYMPKAGDCWSAGVLLLEMAGAKGSFFAALGMDEGALQRLADDESQHAPFANKILGFFLGARNHESALSCMAGTQDEEICDVLAQLLQPEEERATFTDLLSEIDQEMLKVDEQAEAEETGQPP